MGNVFLLFKLHSESRWEGERVLSVWDKGIGKSLDFI